MFYMIWEKSYNVSETKSLSGNSKEKTEGTKMKVNIWKAVGLLLIVIFMLSTAA